jgi:hypothetical protein
MLFEKKQRNYPSNSIILSKNSYLLFRPDQKFSRRAYHSNNSILSEACHAKAIAARQEFKETKVTSSN